MKKVARNLFFPLGIVLVLSMLSVPKLEKSLWAAAPALGNIHDIPNSADGKIFQQLVEYGEETQLDQVSMGQIVQSIAHQLLNSEYKAGLLDQFSQETLVVSLRQFDCLLFIENVLAIANNIATKNHSYQAYTKNLENQRYWGGKINGYCSRLHYFSDWIKDNQKRGNIRNITTELGSIKITKKLDFMTTHRQSYKNLAKNDTNFKCIARVEQSLSPDFNYIPTKDIRQTYSGLESGDIVGVATNIPGLDFTHTGFVYRQSNGKVGLIHASPAGKVVIAQDLQNYIGNVDNAIGIVVSRANKPKQQ